MTEGGRTKRTAAIAVSLSVVALVTVVIAVIVVARRGGGDHAVATKPPTAESTGPSKQRVAATDVIRLDRDTVEAITDVHGTPGIKVTDPELRTLLGLLPTDVITALSGRPIKRQFDVYDALLGASMMNATSMFVELTRDNKPMLMRWELDGDLRAARTKARKARVGTALPFPSISPSPSLPFGTSTRDPLVDTIKRIDDFTYEVPRSTIDALFKNPVSVASGARLVPAVRMGQPDGFKIYAIRPSSIYGAIGLRNGDTIQIVNGVPLEPSAMTDLYEKLRTVDSIRIEINRRGTPEALKITVTR